MPSSIISAKGQKLINRGLRLVPDVKHELLHGFTASLICDA